MSRKRPQIVQYAPSTSSTPHTHYERRHRPLKSTVTVNLPETDTQFPMPLANSLLSHADFLDDDRIEQVECEGQEREIHGLALHSVEGARKRNRTQGVNIPLFVGPWTIPLTNFLVGSSSAQLD